MTKEPFEYELDCYIDANAKVWATKLARLKKRKLSSDEIRRAWDLEVMRRYRNPHFAMLVRNKLRKTGAMGFYE